LNLLLCRPEYFVLCKTRRTFANPPKEVRRAGAPRTANLDLAARLEIDDNGSLFMAAKGP
jgi:hypothetical protein